MNFDYLASSDEFRMAQKAQQAEMLLWGLCADSPVDTGKTIAEVSAVFEKLGLVRPKADRIREAFKRSKNVRTLSKQRYAPTRAYSESMSLYLPTFAEQPVASPVDQENLYSNLAELPLPPYVSADRLDDLKRMIDSYARLFLLENSMRGLIEHTLSEALGEDWWNIAAGPKLKRKHEERLANEASKKWAPARSDFGPLYALDWPDLLSLMRKYPEHFLPHLKDINFLHRYDDAGTYRNVVAHNGVLREQDDFDLIRIYYRNWIKQLA